VRIMSLRMRAVRASFFAFPGARRSEGSGINY
jgi:hypothetical protein